LEELGEDEEEVNVRPWAALVNTDNGKRPQAAEQRNGGAQRLASVTG